MRVNRGEVETHPDGGGRCVETTAPRQPTL